MFDLYFSFNFSGSNGGSDSKLKRKGNPEYVDTEEYDLNLNPNKQSRLEDIRYPCDQCEYASPNMDGLRRHKKSIHEGMRYPCDQCEYDAPNTNFLRRHKQFIDEVIRYPCD